MSLSIHSCWLIGFRLMLAKVFWRNSIVLRNRKMNQKICIDNCMILNSHTLTSIMKVSMLLSISRDNCCKGFLIRYWKACWKIVKKWNCIINMIVAIKSYCSFCISKVLRWMSMFSLILNMLRLFWAKLIINVILCWNWHQKIK
jgi:hypothetical protein